MSLYANPDEHAANPPETWEVAKVAERQWHLRDRDGFTLDGFDTKRAAEQARTDSFWTRLYEQERRWYAGEPVAGWKPYAEVTR